MNTKILKTSFYAGIFIVGSFGFYTMFSTLFPVKNDEGNLSQTPDNGSTSKPQPGVLVFEGPKNEICPLNGDKFTSKEKELWETKRPLAVMIENHADSRPQSGLSNADVVYEAIAEGGITRFMALYYCGAQKGASQKYDVGPVRSARTYFLDIASEYADYPLYTHVGGSNCSAPKDPTTGRQAGPCTTNKKAQALEQISDYGWMNKGTWGDLSQFSLPYSACRREPDRVGDTRATEHTMYCSTKTLWSIAADRGLTNMTVANKNAWDKNFRTWQFGASDAPSSGATKISLGFWGDPSYSVTWKYDATKKMYLRQNGGADHIDFNSNSTITAKNIVVQYAKESRSVDEHKHNLYEVVGSGTGILFQNGTKTEITWSKPTRTGRTIFKDKSGKEVNFIPGQIWVEIIPIGTDVNYEG